MDVNLELNKNLFFPRITVLNSDEVITKLGQALVKNQYVKPGYIDAIRQREVEYPTGLPSGDPGVAIPHADYTLVNKTAIAVATLTTPVSFHNMEAVKKILPIQIVIMMAIKEPHGQIEMLQRIVSIIQNSPLRNKIIKADTSDELLNLVKPTLLGLPNK